MMKITLLKPNGKVWLAFLCAFGLFSTICPALHGIEPLSPISFGKGVNYAKICSEVTDDEACDSSNMYGDRQGSAGTRFGSHRLNTTAVSTNPFSSLYSTVISTSDKRFNVLIGVSGDTIYYSTQDTFSDWSILYRGLLTPNQQFSFASAQNSIYMTGNALTDPIFKWDVAASSFGLAILTPSSMTAVIHAKYLLWENGYMLAGNVREARSGLLNQTTYYDDRVYYSYVLKPSSFSIDQFLNVNPGDNDFITGLTSKRSGSIGTSLVNIYKSGSVYGAVFSILAPITFDATTTGDQKLVRLAYGFGHVGESPPENIGTFDIVLSKDGILQWNGGMLARDRLETEKVVISGDIKTLIDRLIRQNTYKNSILKHYPKSNYIVWAYEDADRFPKGRINSVMFYDLLTGYWWPMNNWIVGSLETDKGPEGTGTLMYGDGMDGYVHVVDTPIDLDDSRKEISLDAMEKTEGWANAGISTGIVAVGTASLTLVLNNNTSSITKVAVMPMGEWYDKSPSAGTDKLSFKIAASSRAYLSQLRVDLQVEDVQGQFNTNFSSVVISSTALVSGASVFTTIEIAFSSFPLLANWTAFDTEDVPFAKNFTRFGIRFVATATANLNLFFDDIRLVQGTKNPLNPERLTKRFDLGTLANKEFVQVMLSREKQRDSSFAVDVLSGQGILTNTKQVAVETSKEIFVCGFSSAPGISRLSSTDLTVTGGTTSATKAAFEFENGNADPDYIYAFDYQNNLIVKVDRSSMSVFVSTYGSLGNGSTNFDYVQDIAIETKQDGNILIVDHMNNRLKEHSKKGLSFVREYGQLGNETTSFYNPTSADWDYKSVWVGDDGNQRIAKFTRDYVFQTEAKLDINTIGDLSVRVSPEFLFDAYNRGSDDAVYFTDVVLEKRNKADVSLLNRVVLRPDGVNASSTYTIKGQIALFSRFVIVTFADTNENDGNYYIQKRLQSDLSLVQELKVPFKNFGLIGDGLARESPQDTKPVNLEVLPDPYIQLRFYSKDQIESPFKLFSMSLVATKLPYVP